LERLENALAPASAASQSGTAITRALQDRLADIALLLDAQSAAMVVEDGVAQSRAGEDPERIRQMHAWCVANQSASVAAYERLPEALCAAPHANSDSACGLLSISVRAKRQGNRLVGFYFFRPEEAMEIAWAGKPEKPVQTFGGTVQLSPRHSFDKWVEVRTGSSRPWDPLTMFTAAQLQRRLEALL
jgi:light-regulated signal transduction histidine kinase (bacteriophytochrome)